MHELHSGTVLYEEALIAWQCSKKSHRRLLVRFEDVPGMETLATTQYTLI